MVEPSPGAASTRPSIIAFCTSAWPASRSRARSRSSTRSRARPGASRRSSCCASSFAESASVDDLRPRTVGSDSCRVRRREKQQSRRDSSRPCARRRDERQPARTAAAARRVRRRRRRWDAHGRRGRVSAARVERGKALTTYDDFSRGVLEAVEVAAGASTLGSRSCSRSTRALHQRHDRRHQHDHPAARLARRRADHQRLPGRLPLRRRPAHDRDRRPPPAQRPRPRRPPRDRRDRRADRLVGHDPRPARPRAGQGRGPPPGRGASASTRSRSASSGATPTASTSSRPRPRSRSSTPTSSSPLARRLPGRGRDAALDDGGAQLLRPGQSRRLPDLAQRRSCATPASTGGLAFFQGLGGGISLEKAAPVPARPARLRPGRRRDRRQRAGQADGLRSASCSATWAAPASTPGIIVDNEIHIDKNLELGPFQTGVNIVDVDLGRRRRRLDRLGLRARRAAGRPAERRLDARPGGARTAAATEPTVTDAMVTLGFIDPDHYLGGRVQLKPRARRARRSTTRFGEPLRLERPRRPPRRSTTSSSSTWPTRSARSASARATTRASSSSSPTAARCRCSPSQIAERLGISTIVIPQQQLGLLRARAALARTSCCASTRASAGTSASPRASAGSTRSPSRWSPTAIAGDASTRASPSDQIEIQRSADFRFHGQAYELTLPMPARDAHRGRRAELVRRVPRALRAHLRRGHRLEGRPGLADQLQRHRRPGAQDRARARRGDRATGRAGRHRPRAPRRVPARASGATRRSRSTTTPASRAGTTVEGPAIIDAADTTIYVPPGTTAERDQYINYVLTR